MSFKCEFCELNFKLSCRLNDHLRKNKLCKEKLNMSHLHNKLIELENENNKLKKENETKDKIILELQQKKENNKIININNYGDVNINNTNNFFINQENFKNHLNTLLLDNNDKNFKKKFDDMKKDDITKISNTANFINKKILKKNNVSTYVCKNKEEKIFTYLDSNLSFQDDKNANKLIQSISIPIKQKIQKMIKHEENDDMKLQLKNSLNNIELLKEKDSLQSELFVEIIANENSVDNFIKQNKNQIELEKKLLDENEEFYYEF